ncbi:MAG: tetratricopeptide repeat protein [Acidobacteria bacterium]|nr:tetratricopeptide repeat protein [Acidobacteriota bacterium]
MNFRMITACICVSLSFAGLASAQETTPSEDAAIQAYRQGGFSQAVTLYTKALSETDDAEHRARLHINIGWTLFALGRTDEVNTHLHAGLVEYPALSLIPDYYTEEFLELFDRARRRVIEGDIDGGPPAPDLEATLAGIDSRIAQESDLEAALADIDRLLAAYPLDGRLIPLKVQVLTMLGRTEEAQNLAQGRTEGLLGSGAVGVISIPDLILRANRMLEQGDAETALELLRTAVSRQPSNVAALELMAEAAQEGRNWQEAEFALKSALGLQPENIGLNLRLGEVYLAKGDASAARDVFRQLTQQFPRSDRAWAALGLLDANLGNLDQAEIALARALEENPLLAEVQLAYGELVLRAGDPERALAAFSAAANLLRENPAVQGRTGQALVALGRYFEAEPLLRTAIDQGFNGADVQRALVLCQINQGNFSEGERLLDRVGPGSHGDGDILKSRLLLEYGRPEEALVVLEPLTRVRSGEPMILNLLAVILYRLERYHDAVGVLTQANEMVPSDAVVETNLRHARAALAAVELQAQATPTKAISD